MTAPAKSAAESLLDELQGLPPAVAAARALELPGDAQAVAQRLFDLAHAAYWKRKDLPAVVAFSQAGIRHSVSESDRAADADLSLKLRGIAKGTAFNLASFTWPGWDEPGITITPADLAIGRDAAALNLKLAVELQRPAGPLANAHWLVGAHAVSAGDYDDALRSFATYRDTAPTDDHRHLADGYTAITLLAAGRDVPAALAQFDTTVAALNALNTEDSKFFAEQLHSVRRFFVK